MQSWNFFAMFNKIDKLMRLIKSEREEPEINTIRDTEKATRVPSISAKLKTGYCEVFASGDRRLWAAPMSAS